ncbi:MAG TPA: rhomboid family intramembrane serine protease [Gemmatimonadales bacterium]|nr:rhomboid family intramembrane serine protease [Gemmatimonadales bacterium]
MSFGSPSLPRLTPWLGRLIAVTAIAQLLLETIFVSPGIRGALSMDPQGLASHPWGVFTYLFVHSGILHLATNMLALYLFGTAVENRMGSRSFLLYYLYCGVGAALFSLLLNLFIPQTPFVGASGAVLGVAVAFAMYWPDAEIIVFPIPVPIKARILVIGLAVMDVVAARFFPGGTAHEAHIGGMLAGWLFFKVQSLSRQRPARPPRQNAERVVMVQQTASREAEPRSNAPIRSAPLRPGNDPVAAEVDRVLDKISATGIESLTPDERRFLDEVSKRKKRETN